MPAFSRFAPFGHLAFSGADPPARVVFDSLVASQGEAYAAGGHTEAKLYAHALAFARARGTLLRAGAQQRASTASDLLVAREAEYGLTASPLATRGARRRALVAASRRPPRPTRRALREALAEVLGAGFVDITTNALDAVPSDVHVYGEPTSDEPGIVLTTPGRARRVYQLAAPVVPIFDVGPNEIAPVTLALAPLRVTEAAPVAFGVGDPIVLSPGATGASERVFVLSVTDAGAPVVRPARPHATGAYVVAHRFPHVVAPRRQIIVVVTDELAADASRLAPAARLLERSLRATAQWLFVGVSGADGFRVEVSDLDVSIMTAP